jgi:branched-chain amino acid transport system substrate-binding protein
MAIVRRTHPRRRTIVMLGVLAVMLALTAACGTRLPDSAFQQQGQVITDGGSSNTLPDGSGTSDGSTTTTAGGGNGTGSGGPTGSGGSSNGNAGSGTGSGPGASEGPNTASDVGVTASSIKIGTIVAENGLLGDAFAPAVRGLRAWVGFTNAHGGIHGRKIELKTCDDREDRARSLECARRLVEQEKVFALVATNTRSMGGAAQYLEDHGIPTIGVPITNSFNRYKHFWSVYGSLYARDGKTVGYKGKLISFSGSYRWFHAKLGVTKAAVFSYDIDESSQAGEFIALGLELEGYDVTPYTVSFTAPSFDQPVQDMERRGVQIVFDAMDDAANRAMCDAMQNRGFKVKAKVSTVVSFGDSVGDDYNDTCRNSVYIVGDSQPYSSNVPEIAEFRSAYKRYQPGKPMHQWALEAWAMGNMFADGVNVSAPTRKGLESFMAKQNKYTATGIMTGTEYKAVNGEAKTGEDCFSIARWLDAQGGWVRATDKFPYCYADAKQYLTATKEQGN